MPEHLGSFRENFVLHRAVCCDCNQDLGDRLELWLGRDSFEALQRWRFGQKSISEFKKFRSRAVKLRLPTGTAWGGAILVLRGNDDTDELFVDLTPQIGIKRPGSEEFRFFTDDEFVRRSDEELGIASRSEFKIIGLGNDGSERMIGLLRERVPALRIDGAMPPPPYAGAEVIVSVRATVNALLTRAIAKIAFSYMTHFAGTNFALHEGFNGVRRFIRYDEGTWKDFVEVSARPVLANDALWYGAVRGHLVTVAWPRSTDSIVSNVSLFNEIAYVVRLSPRCSTVWRPLEYGNLFDWETGEIYKLRTGGGLIFPWQMVKP